MNDYVLALYDFASKQEYIYRTSKIKEIAGASELLADMYKDLIDVINKELSAAGLGQKLSYFDNGGGLAPFTIAGFRADESVIGQILYDGGGNLMVLYKSHDIYITANKIMSRFILKTVPGLKMTASFSRLITDEKGEPDFSATVSELYRINRLTKNTVPVADMSEVTPFTQVDPQTFLPVTSKKDGVSLSSDRKVKKDSYEAAHRNDESPDDFDGLTAVVYIDGNSLGNRVRKCTSEHSFDTGVQKLRDFSAGINKWFVTDPEAAIKNYLHSEEDKPKFRKILGAGDEITFICDADSALKLVMKYFETLEKSNSGDTGGDKNYSCAGIAVAHAKSPFNMIYELAEAACESAKSLSRGKEGNFLDFYYCHAGVTNDFETFRRSENRITAKPYQVTSMLGLIRELAPKLLVAGRANVKALGEAAQKSGTLYCREVIRVNAYISEKCRSIVKHPDSNENKSILKLLGFDPYSYDSEDKAAKELADILHFSENEQETKTEMSRVYDLAEFYDLWFSNADDVAAMAEVKL